MSVHGPKMPKSTREVIHGVDGAVVPPPPALGPVLAPYLADHPTMKLIDDDRLGELTYRLTIRRDLTPEARVEPSPLGLAADRLAVLQDQESGVLVGIAWLVFDSPDQAARFTLDNAGATATLGPGAVLLGRSVVAPIGPLDPQALALVVAEAGRYAPPDVATGADTLLVHLDGFVRKGLPGSWDAFLTLLHSCDPAGLGPLADQLAIDLFELPDKNLPREQASWTEFDRRQLELGRRAADDLAPRLAEDLRSILDRAAVVTLADDDALPVAVLNAIRWLAKTQGRGLPAADREVARASANRRLADRPDLLNRFLERIGPATASTARRPNPRPGSINP